MDDLTPNQQRLAALADAEKIGERMADAMLRRLSTSRVWDGKDLPPIGTHQTPPVPPGVTHAAPRTPQQPPEEQLTPPQTPPRVFSPPLTSWTPPIVPQSTPLVPMAASPIKPSPVWTQLPVASSPRERELSGGLAPADRAAVPLPGGTPAPLARSVVSESPRMPTPMAAPAPLRLAADTFRQVEAGTPLPAAGFSTATRKAADTPQWASDLTAAIKELTREMAEIDEDETERGENAPRRETKEREPTPQPMRISRQLPTATGWAPRPARSQPPLSPVGGN